MVHTSNPHIVHFKYIQFCHSHLNKTAEKRQIIYLLKIKRGKEANLCQIDKWREESWAYPGKPVTWVAGLGGELLRKNETACPC